MENFFTEKCWPTIIIEFLKNVFFKKAVPLEMIKQSLIFQAAPCFAASVIGKRTIKIQLIF